MVAGPGGQLEAPVQQVCPAAAVARSRPGVGEDVFSQGNRERRDGAVAGAVEGDHHWIDTCREIGEGVAQLEAGAAVHRVAGLAAIVAAAVVGLSCRLGLDHISH